MLTISKETPFTNEQVNLLQDNFGEPTARDSRKFLYPATTILNQAVMRAIVHRCREPITVAMNGPGTVIQLEDGKRFVTFDGGWKPVTEH